MSLKKEQVGCLADVCAAVAKQQAGGEVQAIGKDCNLIGTAIVVRIFEDFDAITRFSAGSRAERVFVKFEHPEPAALVPGHGDWIDDFGFGGEKSDFETRREDELFLGVGCGKSRVRRGGIRAGQLAASAEGRQGACERKKNE